MGKYKDITGEKFGRLTAIRRYSQKGPGGKTVWVCKCECENVIVATLDNLRSGGVRSCGCLRKEKSAQSARSRTRHNPGEYGTPLYSKWNQIKSRCNNPNSSGYQFYGAKGITVNSEWAKDFQAFKTWAISNGYKNGDWIIRKDKNGPFDPENCIVLPRSEVK